MADKEDGVKAKSVEVAGVKINEDGNFFATPSGEMSDGFYVNPLRLPKKDPNRYYAFYTEEQASVRLGMGFRAETRKNIGLGDVGTLDGDVSASQDTVHRAGNLVLLSCEKDLADKYLAMKAQDAKQKVNEVRRPKRTVAREGETVDEGVVKDTGVINPEIGK